MAKYRIHSLPSSIQCTLNQTFWSKFCCLQGSFYTLEIVLLEINNFCIIARILTSLVKSSPKVITLVKSIKHLEGAHFTTKENVLARGGQISNFILDICYDVIQQIIWKEKCLHCVDITFHVVFTMSNKSMVTWHLQSLQFCQT